MKAVKRRLYWRFRLRPARQHRHYYTVYVFRGLPLFQAYLSGMRRNEGRGMAWARTAQGMCRSETTLVRRNGRWRRSPKLGRILLVETRLGAGYVAHELTHAAIGWARRVGLRPHAIWQSRQAAFEGRANERFCRAVETLNREFWNRWYARPRP